MTAHQTCYIHNLVRELNAVSVEVKVGVTEKEHIHSTTSWDAYIETFC